ncbi:hypothetical protein [Acidilobus saccharovorans]|uniref:hypothetical protein n=1 Tax=Acidilobus saccharovorans TaxID=242703 RepID=UPI003B83A041
MKLTTTPLATLVLSRTPQGFVVKPVYAYQRLLWAVKAFADMQIFNYLENIIAAQRGGEGAGLVHEARPSPLALGVLGVIPCLAIP